MYKGQGQGRGAAWVRKVYQLWFKKVVKAAAAEMLDEWKGEGVPLQDLEAFAESQWRRYKTKGRGKNAVNDGQAGKDHEH